MSKLEALKQPQYGNYIVYAPGSDEIMFRCTKKRAEWYLKRNLAVIVQDTIIRLTFKPTGPGHESDKYFTQKFKNRCVVCGVDNNLTKHHVVPNGYRKFFPRGTQKHWRRYWSYDVLSMCIKCHKKYEVHANKLKRSLINNLGIPKRHMGLLKDDWLLIQNLRTLANKKITLPPERYLELQIKIQEKLGIVDIDEKDYPTIIGNLILKKTSKVPDSKFVVDSIKDINKFATMWREHFVKHTNPKFMPKYWTCKKIIYDVCHNKNS